MKNTLTVTASDDREIVITRDFDAPRPLVWEAMSQPDLLKRWMSGPPGWETTLCEEDRRVGGTFRCIWTGPDGVDLAMTGKYREIVPPERVVRTEVFTSSVLPLMDEQLATLELTETGAKTSLKLTIAFPSKEARDAALASGMDAGLAAGYDRLDAILGATAA